MRKIQNHRSLFATSCAFHLAIAEHTEALHEQKKEAAAIVHRREIQCYGRYLQLHSTQEQAQQYAMPAMPQPFSIVYTILRKNVFDKKRQIKLIRSL